MCCSCHRGDWCTYTSQIVISKKASEKLGIHRHGTMIPCINTLQNRTNFGRRQLSLKRDLFWLFHLGPREITHLHPLLIPPTLYSRSLSLSLSLHFSFRLDQLVGLPFRNDF